jgi:protein-S-isoprenylcysteine O-methyltransferase Ste14
MTGETPFRAAFWVSFGLLALIRVVFAARVRRAGERLMPDTTAVRREGLGVFVLRVASFFLLIGLLAAYWLDPPWMHALRLPLPAWLRWAGFGLGLLSLALLAWTEAALGAQWSAQLQLRDEHELITTGPYARVRHPLYTSVLGFGLGVALLTAHVLFVVFAILGPVGVMVRAPKEEQMLLERFGEAYRAYMQSTGRFFPR